MYVEPDRTILPGGVGEGTAFPYPRGSDVQEYTGRIVRRAEAIPRVPVENEGDCSGMDRGDACVAPVRTPGFHG